MKTRLLLLLSFCLFCTGICFGQSHVVIILKKPPPNRLGVGDMWNLTVTNTSGKEVRLYLRGSGDEAKEGRLVEGKTGLFSLKDKETRTITANNIPGGGTYSWQNRKFQEAMLRTGNAPDGDYTFCVYAESEDGAPLGQDCFQQSIALMSPPTLVSPADREEITDGPPIIFTWLGSPAAGRGAKYTLKIVEVVGRESPSEALQKRTPWFEKTDIAATICTYPNSARAFEQGKNYAWQVISGDEQSEAWSFSKPSMRKGNDPPPDYLASCLEQGISWKIGGNEIITDPENFYLGTCNEVPLVIGTTRSERMRITTDGKVGIGTTAPQAMLDVRSRIRVSGPGNQSAKFTGVDLVNEGTDLYSRVNISFKNIAPTYGNMNLLLQNEINSNSFIMRNNLYEGGFLDYLTINLGSNDIIVNANKNAGQYGNVLVNNGMVGIGTNSPSELLDIMGNIRLNGNDIYLRSDLDKFHGLGWYGFDQMNPDAAKKFSDDPDGQPVNVDGPVLYGYSGGALGINHGGIKTIALRWQADGKVGIGIFNPEYKLDVAGTIRMCEGIVSMAGCDFVFEPTYELLTIEKRKQLVLNKKHLPNIKPAKDMQDNGASIGETSTGLLQNLEEHELYLYDHDKKIEELFIRMEKIEKENETLKYENRELRKAIREK